MGERGTEECKLQVVQVTSLLLITREEALMRVVWTVEVVKWDLVHTVIVPVTTSGPDGTKIPREVALLRAVWERCKR